MMHKLTRFMRYSAACAGIALTVLAVGVALPLAHYPMAAVEPRPLVIDGVSIVDLRSGVARPGQSIIVAGGRILYAGDQASAPIPPAARRVSGQGKFAMAGLWDMHVHTFSLSPQLHFPLLIANGVTSVRDMGDGCSFRGRLDCQPPGAEWTRQFETGKLLAPRIVSTASYHVEEPEEGLVKALKARGDRLLKLQLERTGAPQSFHLLVRQGRDAGMVVAGHVPYTVDLLDPTLGALHSIEHDESLLPQCAAAGTAFDGRTRSKAALVQRIDATRCAAVLSSLAARGTAYVPTHVGSSQQDWVLPRGHYRSNQQVRYVALPQRVLWRGYAAMTVAGTGDDDLVPIEAWYLAALKLTAQARAAGVAVMAGSDSIDAYVLHGFALHDELAQLVKAGLTPAQALAAATLVPARHMGLEADFGSVEAGKVADIVILNRNPLDDIANARAIDSVMQGGVLHERKSLDAMLAFVEAQASSFSTNSKYVWAMIRPWG